MSGLHTPEALPVHASIRACSESPSFPSRGPNPAAKDFLERPEKQTRLTPADPTAFCETKLPFR